MDDEPGSVPPVSVDGSAPDRTGYRALLAGTAVAGLAVALLLISSPDLEAELRLLGAGALQVAPFVLVAMAAYLAEDSRPLRYVTGVLLLGLIGALVLVSFAFGLLAVLPPGGLDGPDLPPGTEGTALALLGLRGHSVYAVTTG
ncbi:MAG TPA: hypothetical protein PLI31_06695, partial [Methanoregulaceae archaeon]|nr:hypothetical protein [Methanoregulaceae archaeon]